MIKDSGDRTEFETGAKRDIQHGKGRMDLLPWYGIMEVSKHCEEGAEKYGEHNVDKGIPLHSLCDSAARHLAKFIVGEMDEDHLRAACWNLLWALNQRKTHPELDDLYSHREKVEKVQNIILRHSAVIPLLDELDKAKENGEVVFDETEKMIDESVKIKSQPLTFAELIIRHGELVLAEEYLETDKIYEGPVTVNVCFEKNEIQLCPDLSNPDDWFFYDEGFVKCYDVDPFTGEKEG